MLSVCGGKDARTIIPYNTAVKAGLSNFLLLPASTFFDIFFLKLKMLLQRVDAEKSRHRTFITSDIRLQINEMNQKVKEEWEKKQAEAEKLKKPSEVCYELIIYVLIFTLAHRHCTICSFWCRVKKVMVELTVRRRKKIIVQRV